MLILPKPLLKVGAIGIHTPVKFIKPPIYADVEDPGPANGILYTRQNIKSGARLILDGHQGFAPPSPN